jgi:DNA-binding transcriptional regulator YiaG
MKMVVYKGKRVEAWVKNSAVTRHKNAILRRRALAVARRAVQRERTRIAANERRKQRKRQPRYHPPSADQIKQLRYAMGMDQKMFARQLNCSWWTVAQWEQGRTHPRRTQAKMLAHMAASMRIVWHEIEEYIPGVTRPRPPAAAPRVPWS